MGSEMCIRDSYHRDQCDMITMILRLAAEPAWRYERGRQMKPAADRNRQSGGCGTRVIDQACPWERVLYCYFSAPGALCHFEKAHPNAPGVSYYRANSNKNKKNNPGATNGKTAGLPQGRPSSPGGHGADLPASSNPGMLEYQACIPPITTKTQAASSNTPHKTMCVGKSQNTKASKDRLSVAS